MKELWAIELLERLYGTHIFANASATWLGWVNRMPWWHLKGKYGYTVSIDKQLRVSRMTDGAASTKFYFM